MMDGTARPGVLFAAAGVECKPSSLRRCVGPFPRPKHDISGRTRLDPRRPRQSSPNCLPATEVARIHFPTKAQKQADGVSSIAAQYQSRQRGNLDELKGGPAARSGTGIRRSRETAPRRCLYRNEGKRGSWWVHSTATRAGDVYAAQARCGRRTQGKSLGRTGGTTVS